MSSANLVTDLEAAFDDRKLLKTVEGVDHELSAPEVSNATLPRADNASHAYESSQFYVDALSKRFIISRFAYAFGVHHESPALLVTCWLLLCLAGCSLSSLVSWLKFHEVPAILVLVFNLSPMAVCLHGLRFNWRTSHMFRLLRHVLWLRGLVSQPASGAEIPEPNVADPFVRNLEKRFVGIFVAYWLLISGLVVVVEWVLYIPGLLFWIVSESSVSAASSSCVARCVSRLC